MKAIFCGSRDWDDKKKIYEVMCAAKAGGLDLVIHGDCQGADQIAGTCAKELGIELEIYPANWDKFGRGAGPKRNAKMLSKNPDLVFAFHDDLKHSKGTKNMVNKAKARGVPVLVFKSTENTHKLPSERLVNGKFSMW